MKHRTKIIILLSYILLGLNACVARKDLVYFDNIPANDPTIKLGDYTEPVVQLDDILHITIQTIDGGLAMVSDQLSGGVVDHATAATTNHNSVPAGYLVDKAGKITMPMLGTFEVAGLTTLEVREMVTKAASKYFKEPTVQVRFANFKITVLGEVARPSTYTVPSERINLLDALGMAGDMTILGDRKNVLLIRDNSGEKQFIRFNLNEYETFTSPYFYLKQNDVIYVEPGRGRVAANNAGTVQFISIALSALSVITLVITRL
ncbi:polysaccharide biosynthesis/export family protein [Parapedobacter deserti]|uniref:Polysaccharide biosynthesis/export family protein n=1 Tax=Parapedobacter deserti TaxID=1912957 RepID=A0ABV7JLK6_9SPHI